MSTIYKITNTVNNKVYIGQTIRKVKVRFLKHRNDLRNNKHSNKHLQSSWNKHGEASFTFEVIDTAAFIFNVDNLERYWIKHYGSTNSNKGYNKTSGGNANKVFHIESRKKMSKAHLGRKHSDLTKNKMSESKKGQKYTLGKRLTEEHKKNISKNSTYSRRVIDITCGNIWDSVTEAAQSINIHQGTLYKWLSGYSKNKSNLRFLEA